VINVAIRQSTLREEVLEAIGRIVRYWKETGKTREEVAKEYSNLLTDLVRLFEWAKGGRELSIEELERMLSNVTQVIRDIEGDGKNGGTISGTFEEN